MIESGQCTGGKAWPPLNWHQFYSVYLLLSLWLYWNRAIHQVRCTPRPTHRPGAGDSSSYALHAHYRDAGAARLRISVGSRVATPALPTPCVGGPIYCRQACPFLSLCSISFRIYSGATACTVERSTQTTYSIANVATVDPEGQTLLIRCIRVSAPKLKRQFCSTAL
jgi:hypothetical protein